jgi:hypothetical protein
MVISKGWRRVLLFLGSNLGLLCKVLPLSALDKIVRFEENNINLRAYDDRQNLVWKMLEMHNLLVCANLDKAEP